MDFEFFNNNIYVSDEEKIEILDEHLENRNNKWGRKPCNINIGEIFDNDLKTRESLFEVDYESDDWQDYYLFHPEEFFDEYGYAIEKFGFEEKTQEFLDFILKETSEYNILNDGVDFPNVFIEDNFDNQWRYFNEYNIDENKHSYFEKMLGFDALYNKMKEDMRNAGVDVTNITQEKFEDYIGNLDKEDNFKLAIDIENFFKSGTAQEICYKLNKYVYDRENDVFFKNYQNTFDEFLKLGTMQNIYQKYMKLLNDLEMITSKFMKTDEFLNLKTEGKEYYLEFYEKIKEMKDMKYFINNFQIVEFFLFTLLEKITKFQNTTFEIEENLELFKRTTSNFLYGVYKKMLFEE